jgi:uncharacterized lipoprotein YmbA
MNKVLIPLAGLAVGVLSGCLSRPSLIQQSFCFAAPAALTNSAAPNARVLAIRSIRVAAPYDSQSLVYRTGEFSYERDPYAQFLISPAASLRQPLRAFLANSGVFQAVATPDSALPVNTVVEVFVRQLYGDLRNSSHPAAVLDMSFIFFDAPQGIPGRVLFRKDFARRIPLTSRTATGVIAGWNQALREIASEVDSDLEKLPDTGASGSHSTEFRGRAGAAALARTGAVSECSALAALVARFTTGPGYRPRKNIPATQT